MTTPFDHKTLPDPQNSVSINAFIQDIETRYNNSLTNHMYVFPKHLSSNSSLNTSLKSLDEAKSYNLHSQNAKRYCLPPENTRPSSQESLIEEYGTILTKDLKINEGNVAFEDRAVLDTFEKKVLSLGREDLIDLFKKRMTPHQENLDALVKENKETSQGKRNENGSVAKTLVMKIVKERESKKKDMDMGPGPYGLQQRIIENKDKKPSVVQRKDDKIRENSREKSQSKYAMQIKEFVKFSKEFGNLLQKKAAKEKVNQNPGKAQHQTAITIKKEEAVNKEKEQVILETSESIIEKKPVEAQVEVKKPVITGYCENLKQNLANLSENKRKDKKLEGKTSPSSKKINLYMCYRSSAM